MSETTQLQERLTAYHDEQLSADDAAVVERMLADEPDAEAFVRDARSVDALLGAATDAATGEQFDLSELKRQVMDRTVAVESPSPMAALAGRRPFLRGLILGSIATAALVLIAVTAFLAGRMRRSPGPDEQAGVMIPHEPSRQQAEAERVEIPKPVTPSPPPIPIPQEDRSPSPPRLAMIDPPAMITPPFVTPEAVMQPDPPVPSPVRLVFAPPPSPPPPPPPSPPPPSPLVNVAALETLRTLRSSQTLLTRMAAADPLELAAWRQLVEQMNGVRLLAELRKAKGRTKAGSSLRRCLVTLEVILLRARHARRLEARVAVQDAIRETEMFEQVRRMQSPAVGEPS